MSPEIAAWLAKVGAAAEGPAQVLFGRVDDALAALVGRRLCTVMRLHADTMELERIFSSNPGDYPVGARKTKRGLPWTDLVLVRSQPFVGRHASDLRWAFDDADKLIALGLGSVINQPIIARHKIVGTLNVLDIEGAYDASAAKIVGVFSPSLAQALLAYHSGA